jgi:diadenylate cyclase
MTPTQLAPQHVVDFAVLAVGIYGVLRWASGARALRLCVTALGLSACGVFAQRVGLFVTAWMLHIAGALVAVLIIVLFPSEFRYALLRLDAVLRPRRKQPRSAEYGVLAQGVFDLAEHGTGVLVVLPRVDALDGLATEGIPVSMPLSPEMLSAVFHKTSPLHDGAIVAEGDLIVAVKVLLPLTARGDLPTYYGTRHRAALGLSECCDAVVVVASEATGHVSVAMDGSMNHCGSATELADALRNELTLRHTRARPGMRFVAALLSRAALKLATLGLTIGIWYVFVVSTGTVVRTFDVPVELTNIPDGFEISEQSASRVTVELRGSALLIDSVDQRPMVARIPVAVFKTGTTTVRVTPEALHVDPGIAVDRIIPDQISIRIDH